MTMREADVNTHLNALYGQDQFAPKLSFMSIYNTALKITTTALPLSVHLRRTRRSYFMACNLRAAMAVDGAVCECGVYRGGSALMMSQILKAHDPSFTGNRLTLVDSFEGLSSPTEEDYPTSSTHKADLLKPGSFKCPLEAIKNIFKTTYPDTSFVKGWIPESLNKLPEQKYAFVNLDLDLYKPIKGALEYFIDRMSPGGVIINDDYLSPFFQGAQRSWDEVFSARGLPTIGFQFVKAAAYIALPPHPLTTPAERSAALMDLFDRQAQMAYPRLYNAVLSSLTAHRVTFDLNLLGGVLERLWEISQHIKWRAAEPGQMLLFGGAPWIGEALRSVVATERPGFDPARIIQLDAKASPPPGPVAVAALLDPIDVNQSLTALVELCATCDPALLIAHCALDDHPQSPTRWADFLSQSGRFGFGSHSGQGISFRG